jgi:murein DD-endopeptidase MepM/ murein hydrolase activator NlpD
LQDVAVTVRKGGVNVRARPNVEGDKLGNLDEGSQKRTFGLVFRDFTWLQFPWNRRDQRDQVAWIAAEYTDFPRSSDYTQVVDEWYESDAVLKFRRKLAHDLMSVRKISPDKIEQVDTLRGEDLRKLEDALTRQTMLPGYVKFWQLQQHLGLPDPFEYLPVLISPPSKIDEMEFSGFGPNSFAFRNWSLYYEETRGMHNGVDYVVPEGSPLVAVSDGVIVSFNFLGNPNERSLALRPYLPDTIRDADGARVLSNLVVAYGHLTGDPTSDLVRVGDEVKAGQVIGTSGWPVYTLDDGSMGLQYNNAHLHLETHLITDGTQQLGSRQPFNPMLFWSPRLIAWQARLARSPYPSSGQPYGKLGFFSVAQFAYEPSAPRVWDYEPTREAPWPHGIYSLDSLFERLSAFQPYSAPGR